MSYSGAWYSSQFFSAGRPNRNRCNHRPDSRTGRQACCWCSRGADLAGRQRPNHRRHTHGNYSCGRRWQLPHRGVRASGGHPGDRPEIGCGCGLPVQRQSLGREAGGNRMPPRRVAASEARIFKVITSARHGSQSGHCRRLADAVQCPLYL